MKKQVLALSCALALGASAALSPATDQAAEPTAQVGYAVSQYLGATGGGAAAIESAASAAGAHAGYRIARTKITTTVIRGMTARSMVVVGARLGASAGLVGGFAGVIIGGAVGAL